MDKNDKIGKALKRMETLGISRQLRDRFRGAGYPCFFDSAYGIVRGVNDWEIDNIRKFEDEFDSLVYAVVRSHSSMGDMDSYLFVSSYGDEWESEDEELAEGSACAWVRNCDVPEFSEMGYIGLGKDADGLITRTW